MKSIVAIVCLIYIMPALGQTKISFETFKSFTKAYGYLVHFCPDCSIKDRFQFGLNALKRLEKHHLDSEVAKFAFAFSPYHKSIRFSSSTLPQENHVGKYATVNYGMPDTRVASDNQGSDRKFMRYIEGIYYRKQIAPGQHFSNHTLNKRIGDELFMSWPLTGSKYKKNTSSAPNQYDINLVEVRLLAMAELWNIIQHFSPHHSHFQVQWERAIEHGYTVATESKSKADFICGIQELLALTNDAHAGLKERTPTPLYYPEIEIEPFHNRWIVTQGNNKVQTGDEITHINGRSLSFLHDSIRSTISSPSEQHFRYASIRKILGGALGEELQLGLKRANKTAVVKVKKTSKVLKAFYNRTTTQQYENGILYANLNLLSASQLSDIVIDKLSSYKGLILDLRNYPRTSLFPLFTHIISGEVHGDFFITPQFMLPDREEMNTKKNGSQWKIEGQGQLDIPIIVLTSGRAFSAAESYLALISKHQNVTLIGEETAGTNGNQNFFLLPGGMEVAYTGMQVFSEKHQRVVMGKGIVPDIKVSPDLESMRAGKDYLLDHALEQLIRKD